MNLPAHLQDLVDSGVVIDVAPDNCKGHRRRESRDVHVEQGICCVQSEDCWNDSSSSLESLPLSCRWENTSCKGDKAPTLKSRRLPGPSHATNTSLLQMMKPPARCVGEGMPRPALATSLAAFATANQDNGKDAGEYIGRILESLELFSDL